jgi:chlorophyll synthase
MTGALPDGRIMLAALLYSAGAHGIMTLNDFKSVEGDRQMGIRSLPVILGVERAALFACWTMAVPQVVVVGLLLRWGAPFYAIGVTALLAAQFALMKRFLDTPRAQAIFYNATGTTLYVLGMLVTAFALRGLGTP